MFYFAIVLAIIVLTGPNTASATSPEDVGPPMTDLEIWAPKSTQSVLGAVVAERRCSRCHGVQGISRSGSIPNLAGQKQAYLVTQLKTLKQSRDIEAGEAMATRHRYRRHPAMSDHAGGLSDRKIFSVAAYYAEQACGPTTTTPRPPRPAVAKPCVTCHSDRPNEHLFIAPRLAGQHQPYLARQLRMFREALFYRDGDKTRIFRYHSTMKDIARGLTGADIQAVTAYYAALPCGDDISVAKDEAR